MNKKLPHLHSSKNIPIWWYEKLTDIINELSDLSIETDELVNKIDKRTSEKISEIVGAAPETLNTLAEIATAVQSTNEFVAKLNEIVTGMVTIDDVNNAIKNAKISVDQIDGDIITNNDNIATKAWVLEQLNNGGSDSDNPDIDFSQYENIDTVQF